MASITSRSITAGSVTLMDVMVTSYSGPIVWKAWGAPFWSRTGLLALAGAMAFTLMDIWSQTLTEQSLLSLEADTPCALTQTGSAEQMEGADV